MLKIGDFSKLSLVSVKALRYYDEIGLFKPVSVDEFTGYRYYSPEQMPRLNRILALKDLGLSLEQVAELLTETLTAEHIRGILRLKALEAREQMEEARARLARVEARLQQIEREGKQPMYEVVRKEVPTQRIAVLRRVIPSYSDVGKLFGELFGQLQAQGIHPTGPTMTIYHDTEFKDENPDIEAAVPVAAPLGGQGPVKVRDLNGGEMACTIHKGPYEGIGEGYGAVMAWMAPNGYQPAGMVREVHLRSPSDVTDPAEYVTEIQLPVSKS